mmetsp:Transcript_103953/g.291172  ORF Transcript_103953/g.291172 Transcript_103953/m.291172 type:complete len:232 (-) Transcript_103953:162-857(-)
MSGYGAVEAPQDVRLPVGGSVAVPTGPIFLENPDGSITEAVPSGYKDPRLKGKQRRSLFGQGQTDDSDSNSDTAAVSMYREVDFLYSRHEKVLVCLLLLQLVLEVLYHVVYVVHMRNGSSVMEFAAMYAMRIEPKAAETVLWVVFGISLVYTMTYYVIAGLALWTKRPKQYRLFANFGIAGIVGLILLAYVDKFNLIIFFLHLLAYIYARFLQGLTASLLLLPPAPPLTSA